MRRNTLKKFVIILVPFLLLGLYHPLMVSNVKAKESMTKTCGGSSGGSCEVNFSNFIDSGETLDSAEMEAEARGSLLYYEQEVNVDAKEENGLPWGYVNCDDIYEECTDRWWECSDYTFDVYDEAKDDNVTFVCDATDDVGYCSGPDFECRITLTWDYEQPPHAGFDYSPEPAVAGESTDFYDWGTYDPDNNFGDTLEGIVSRKWDFDGDGSWDSTGEDVSHTFYSRGNYNVTLKVKDEEGDTDSITKSVEVTDAPSANFSYSPGNPEVNETINFDASGSSDPDGYIDSYDWSWTSGYGWDASGQTTSHSYGSSGDYDVTLQVVDNDGATDRLTRTVSVSSSNQAPTANANGPYSGDRTQTVTLDGSGSSDSDGSVANYQWEVGGSQVYSGSSATYNLDLSGYSPGTYNVTLTVTDNNGASDNDSTNLDVNNLSPTADFTYSPSNPDTDDTIDFDASGSSDPDGTINSYQWDWTNNGSWDATGEKTSHNYSSPDSYDVTLQVTDNDGQTDSTTKTIDVAKGNEAPDKPTNPSPSDGADEISIGTTLSVDVSDDDGESMDVKFYLDGSLVQTVNNVSSGSTAETSSLFLEDDTNYDWYAVADDGTDSTQSDTWTFTTISGGDGVPDTFDTPLHRYPAPDFTHSPTTPEINETVTFYDESECYSTGGSGSCSDPSFVNYGSIDYAWDFSYDPGDGFNVGDTTQGTTTKTYSTEGDYTVKLRVTDYTLDGNPYCESTGDTEPAFRVTVPLPEWEEVSD